MERKDLEAQAMAEWESKVPEGRRDLLVKFESGQYIDLEVATNWFYYKTGYLEGYSKAQEEEG